MMKLTEIQKATIWDLVYCTAVQGTMGSDEFFNLMEGCLGEVPKEVREGGLERHVKTCRYWRDTSECQCASPTPIGGCLRCDMGKAVEVLNEAIDGIALLQQWKKEALQVMGEWERVWTAAGSPGTLGQSKAEAVLSVIATPSSSGPAKASGAGG